MAERLIKLIRDAPSRRKKGEEEERRETVRSQKPHTISRERVRNKIFFAFVPFYFFGVKGDLVSLIMIVFAFVSLLVCSF